jgi:hypothetical protein
MQTTQAQSTLLDIQNFKRGLPSDHCVLMLLHNVRHTHTCGLPQLLKSGLAVRPASSHAWKNLLCIGVSYLGRSTFMVPPTPWYGAPGPVG